MASAEGDEEPPPQGVIVAVRVRPLWVKGREKGCTSVVRMEGNTTILHPDPEEPEAEPRKYAFDYSYWSSDRCIQDDEGVWRPDGPDSPYADQDKVWGDIGSIILKNATRGFNCTVFAYGQSGAGKSYSVVGYAPNVGIIPRATKEVFNIADSNTDPNVKYEVDIAMVEVYMEKIYDLLDPDQAKRQELKVFINRGEVYIYNPNDRRNRDVIYRACKNAEQAETFRLQGDKNRTVRATGMNPTSSRAHTLFVLRLRKLVKTGEEWVEEFRSKINLVDLAGSERPADTGLSGIGLEEGVAINSSLSALGRVMVQLVEGKRVNYRASKLTEVLAESLNGRAVTCMIAALSPADINFGDTLSTLRFADNAKKMPVKVEKQLSPTQQLIEDLRKENDALKKRLGLTDGAEGGSTEEADAEAQMEAEEARARADKLQAEAEALRQDLEKARADLAAEELDDAQLQARIRDLEAKLVEANEANAVAEQAEEVATGDLQALKERQEAIEAVLQEQRQSFESRLQASEREERLIKQAMDDSCLTVREMFGVFGRGQDLSKVPYLVNLLADPAASLVVVLNKDIPVVNRTVGASGGRLQLSGDTIAACHATFKVAGGAVVLEPRGEAKTFVNGMELVKARELTHGDRIVFGMEHAFRFVEAGGKPTELLKTPKGPVVQDWDFCISEIAKRQGKTQLVMQGVLAKVSSERAVKRLQAKVAEYEKELARLRGEAAPAAAAEVSAQEMAVQIMGGGGGGRDDKVLGEVKDLRDQLAQTRQALEVLHSLNGVVEGKQENKIDQLSSKVQKGDSDLAARLETVVRQHDRNFEASQDERKVLLQMLRDLQKSVDGVAAEQRKCCRCQCSVS